ncbi:MAG: hypothetical protein ABUT39_28030 [Acidobacteriota bacterium]
MTGDGNARAEEVHRRWRRTSLDVMSRSSWAGWTLQNAGFISGMGAAMLLLFLEPALWFRSWPPWTFDHRAAVALGLLSLAAVPVHGLLLDRFLSAKTPLERAMPRWLLALRFLAACVPLFSFLLLPGWKTLLARHPPWAWPRARRRLDLGSGDGPVRRRMLPVFTSGFFVAYLALACVLLIFWALWLAQTGALGTARKPVIAGVCATLHLVAAIGARLHFTPLRQTKRLWLVEAAPWLCLVPVLGPFVALTGPELWTEDREGAGLLSWSAWAWRSHPGRLPPWRSMERLRQPRSAAPRKARAGDHERALLSFYRGKTALLLLDGAVLLVGLTALAKRFPALSPAVSLAARGAPYAGIPLSALGLLVLAAAASPRLRGKVPELAVFGRYLLFTPLALLAGGLAGLLWLAGDLKSLGLLMMYGGALLAGFGFLSFLPSYSRVSRISMSWLLWFLLLTFCGAPVLLDERLHGWPSRVLAAAAFLAPLWSLLLFRRFAPWLPRPLVWRDIRDIRDIRNGRLSWRIRTALILLGAAAAVPGGGLAIPAWIALGARLRHWNRSRDLVEAREVLDAMRPRPRRYRRTAAQDAD